MWLIVIGIIIAFFYYNSKNNSTSTSSSTAKTINVSIENVKISKDHKNAWAVKGLVRNNTSSTIKGAVNIKFINSKGDIVHTTKSFVNGDDYFDSGQAAIFEYFTDPSDFIDVVDFKIEFYER